MKGILQKMQHYCLPAPAYPVIAAATGIHPGNNCIALPFIGESGRQPSRLDRDSTQPAVKTCECRFATAAYGMIVGGFGAAPSRGVVEITTSSI